MKYSKAVLKNLMFSLPLVWGLGTTSVHAHLSLQGGHGTNATSTKPSPMTAALLQGFNFENDVIADLQSDLISAQSGILYTSAQILIERVEQVNTPSHTDWIVDYNDKGLVLKWVYDSKANPKDPNFIKELAFLSALAKTRNYDASNNLFEGHVSYSIRDKFTYPHDLAELMMNAKLGSPTAKARLNSLYLEAISPLVLSDQIADHWGVDTNILESVKQKLKGQQEALELEAKKHLSKQNKALENWKKETKAFDKFEAMDKKLNDLILDNDRKGVRKLLEAYLPWAVMEPVEARTWKIWLDAIENPNKNNTTVAFRGISYDTDKIQRRKTSQGEVYGFMSTVLTKNQGNYTRRLRSLSTNRLKVGDIPGANTPTVQITRQMINHADDPIASNFLSFTYDPAVGARFGGRPNNPGGFLAVEMDKRRLIPNIMSQFSIEIELLAPLIVFPDEIIQYREGDFHDIKNFYKFMDDLSKKTGMDFRDHTLSGSQKGKPIDQMYARDGHAFLKDMMTVEAANSCSKVF